MRLIDADEFKKQIAGMSIINNYPPEKANKLCELIDNQNVAYDVDTVVNQLELHSFEFGSDTLPAHYVMLNDAIEIVKEGGMMEARYQKLKSALKDIELDEEEEQTVRWLASWESETVDNMVSIMNKLADQRAGGR